MVDGVAHVEVDAESHLDLVRRLDVVRTPTVLVAGRGRPRRPPGDRRAAQGRRRRRARRGDPVSTAVPSIRTLSMTGTAASPTLVGHVRAGAHQAARGRPVPHGHLPVSNVLTVPNAAPAPVARPLAPARATFPVPAPRQEPPRCTSTPAVRASPPPSPPSCSRSPCRPAAPGCSPCRPSCSRSGAVRGIQATPYAWLFRRFVRPRLAPPAELEDARPPRFAQAVGLVFAARRRPRVRRRRAARSSSSPPRSRSPRRSSTLRSASASAARSTCSSAATHVPHP